MKALYTAGSMSFMPDGPLRGSRILVVEDQILIALTTQDMLRDAGADVVIAADASEAASYLSGLHQFDGAVIDLNLGQGYDTSLAAIAVGRGIPMVFATGYGRVAELPAEFAAIPIVPKPYTGEMLISALLLAMGRPAA